jgi:hypothetical protein
VHSPVIPPGNTSLPKTHWTQPSIGVMVRPRRLPIWLPIEDENKQPVSKPPMPFAIANQHRFLSVPSPEPGNPRVLPSFTAWMDLFQPSYSGRRPSPMRSRVPSQPSAGRLALATCSPGFCTGLCSGTARGWSCALRQLALLLRLHRPAGYGFPRNLVRKPRAKRFLRTLRKCRASALGSMAHSLPSAPIKGRGKFQSENKRICTRTKSASSVFSAAIRNFATTVVAASPRSRWLPSLPIGKTKPTWPAPNGTAASSSASSPSSPPHSRKGRTSRWKANCAAGNM